MLAAVVGIMLCLLYDLIRIWRMIMASGKTAVFFEDIFWFSVTAVATYMVCLAKCNGEVRSYIIIGEISGLILCRMTVSRGIIYVAKPAVKKAKHLLKRLVGVIMHFFEPIKRAVIEKINKIKAKKPKKAKKHLHLRIPMLYNRKSKK